MPWKVSGVVEERKQFVSEYESGEWTMTDLCRNYGISRPTGYALLRRYGARGASGLEECSRAPWRHPNQTPGEIEGAVLELRRRHMRWGPRTLKARLQRLHPEVRWPATSTIGAMLDREGLTQARRKRRRVPLDQQPWPMSSAPNDEWAADFKGWIRTGDGERVDPLTISDRCSRYLLRCQAVEKMDGERVQAIFEAAFREYGMPLVIRSDNGAPFASRAVAGLSRLAVWWIKLGIMPRRIQPGHPEQNGRHERLHRTLAEATASPPAAHRRAQQRAFDEFRREYNQERPHQALAMQTPESVYRSSPRLYPARVPEPEYDSGLLVRRVHKHGQFFWNYHSVFLSKVLSGERVGLLPVDDRYYRIYLCRIPIARLDAQRLQVEELQASDWAMDS